MKRPHTLGWFCALLAMLFGPALALADNVGRTGEIVSIEILESSSDEFTAYRGTLIIRQLADEQDQQYRWGGSACPAKDLDPARVNYLVELASAPYMTLTPYYKPGAGSNLCLVGFRIANRKFL